MFGSSNNSRIGMARQRVRGDSWGDDGGYSRKKKQQSTAQGKHKAARHEGAAKKRNYDDGGY